MARVHPSSGDSPIRLATAADLDSLCDLLTACIEEMRAAGIDQWDADVYPTRSTLEADIGAGTAYVALGGDGRIAGSLVLNDCQNPEYAEADWRLADVRPAVVHRVMVHPACQHRGLARVLMRFAEQRAAALGYRAIRLDAFSENPRALRLYHGLGYRDAGAVRFPKGMFRCFEKALERPSDKE